MGHIESQTGYLANYINLYGWWRWLIIYELCLVDGIGG
jgi:cytochrome c oxidase subunit IV